MEDGSVVAEMAPNAITDNGVPLVKPRLDGIIDEEAVLNVIDVLSGLEELTVTVGPFGITMIGERTGDPPPPDAGETAVAFVMTPPEEVVAAVALALADVAPGVNTVC